MPSLPKVYPSCRVLGVACPASDFSCASIAPHAYLVDMKQVSPQLSQDDVMQRYMHSGIYGTIVFVPS